jgi:predicted HicB family RNase H-like nuclease
MTKNINITIPAELHKQLKHLATDKGVTLKALIIAILSGKQE